MLYKPILLAKNTNKKSDISISEEYLILASNGPKYPRIKVILVAAWKREEERGSGARIGTRADWDDSK